MPYAIPVYYDTLLLRILNIMFLLKNSNFDFNVRPCAM